MVHQNLAFFEFGHRVFPDTNESTTTDDKNGFRPDLRKFNRFLLFTKTIEKATRHLRIIFFDQRYMD